MSIFVTTEGSAMSEKADTDIIGVERGKKIPGNMIRAWIQL